ncbi:MAG: DEAD/DEAH box helicase [Acidobacteria bacterium]|nr:DEAD/DEAH box helicase [Acidobacteriota bacterium]
MPFSPLQLGRELEHAFQALGYAGPFPVQEQAIPRVLAGQDLVVQAPTGTGKTVAFLAPLLHLLVKGGTGRLQGNQTRALVLVPTRELAAQVGERATELAKHLSSPLKIQAVFGGVSVNPQMLALRGGADLVIATPGRLLELVRNNALSLAGLQHLVIDEADKLLELGFRDEMQDLLRQLPVRRQTLMFSATMNTAVEEVIQLFLKAPQRLQVEAALELAVAIEERACLVSQEHKGPFLRELLARETWPQVLVFVASGRRADNVVRKLGNSGIRALSLHGDKSMSARTDALDQFRDGRLRILVATDLIARGIDISGLACVINYDLPRSPKDYTHRIGRTGRAGLTGVAISLGGPAEEAHRAVIEKTVRRRFLREVGKG